MKQAGKIVESRCGAGMIGTQLFVDLERAFKKWAGLRVGS